MSEVKRARQACALGIKALHNIRDASIAFEKLAPVLYRRDNVLLSSLLHYGVVKYSKPFVQSNYKESKVVYPVKSIKDTEGFSTKLHEHIIDVRNTLIAHDDFNEIEPRVIAASFKPENFDISIPLMLKITNKSISHPSTVLTCNKLAAHCKSALKGVTEKLKEDIKLYRQIIIETPSIETVPLASTTLTDFQISSEPTQVKVPDNAFDDVETAPFTPDFSDIHDGFIYNEAIFEHMFYGPEIITLPDGATLELVPNGDPNEQVESEYYTSHIPTVRKRDKNYQ